MLRKQTYLLSGLLALVLAVFIAALVIQSRNDSRTKEEASLRFVSAYGAVNYIQGEHGWLRFTFMTKGDWIFLSDPSFTFESPYVTTKDVKVSKVSTDGHYSFWEVECGILLLGSALEEQGVVPLESVVLAGTVYQDVIDLRLVVFPAYARKDASFDIRFGGYDSDGKM